MSPTVLPTKASPNGQELEILPLTGSDSTVPTIMYETSLLFSRKRIVTVEPKPTFLLLALPSSMISAFAKMFSISLIRPSTSACLPLAAS